MGGRGSKSATKVFYGDIASMTDRQLNHALADAKRKLDIAGKKLDEASFQLTQARMTPRKGRVSRVNSAHRQYNVVQSAFNIARDWVNALESEKVKRNSSNNSDVRPFVNSYGEATRRYITTGTYERAQKRLEREVALFVG